MPRFRRSCNPKCMLLSICCQKIEFHPLWVWKCECFVQMHLCSEADQLAGGRDRSAHHTANGPNKGWGIVGLHSWDTAIRGKKYTCCLHPGSLGLCNEASIKPERTGTGELPGWWHVEIQGQCQPGEGMGAPHPFPKPCSMCLFYLAVPELYSFTITQWSRSKMFLWVLWAVRAN